jgi:hypothetical protein
MAWRRSSLILRTLGGDSLGCGSLRDCSTPSSWPSRRAGRGASRGTSARDVPEAVTALQTAAHELKVPYAVGGVAGTSFVRRAVEPIDVVVWIRRDDAALWAERLAATPSRPAPGRVTMQLSRDPFVLSLASNRTGIQVADPVQLYLDCRSAGERALEAADAIRVEMRW